MNAIKTCLVSDNYYLTLPIYWMINYVGVNENILNVMDILVGHASDVVTDITRYQITLGWSHQKP